MIIDLASSTNVPDIAMSFSDARFAYGPFVPHHIPRQYVENYFSLHQTDQLLVLNTTVEDVSRQVASSGEHESWRLTLRKFDVLQHVDIWWEEIFDAVIIANGHFSIPWVCTRLCRVGEIVTRCTNTPLDSRSPWLGGMSSGLSWPNHSLQILPIAATLCR